MNKADAAAPPSAVRGSVPSGGPSAGKAVVTKARPFASEQERKTGLKFVHQNPFQELLPLLFSRRFVTLDPWKRVRLKSKQLEQDFRVLLRSPKMENCFAGEKLTAQEQVGKATSFFFFFFFWFFSITSREFSSTDACSCIGQDCH
jgi:hypothetical protein